MPGPFYFAWAGGTIEAQTTLVTNGTTHGAIPDLRTLVGDARSPDSPQQLINIASTEGLEANSVYQLAGPGIVAGTYFMYDNSVLSGLPDSVNLSAAPGALELGGQFEATKAVNVGAAVATLTHGSNAISLSLPLPAGIYGIFGTGIGETDVPVGTIDGFMITTGGGIMIVGAAVLTYDGVGSGTLSILAATSHQHSRLDQFGQVVFVTSYSVAAQPVRATASGNFAVQLTGFSTQDRTLVDVIPTGALAGLTPGLIYNITGNGLTLGSTFVAPGGGTSLTLDLPATSSEVNAILTITGPRTPNAPFNPSVHNRFDEEIVSVEIAQDEGGLATLTVELKNPDVGLLAIGRNLWCWLSWDQAWTPGGASAPDLVPLFNGRLIGVPKLQAGEIVQLQFLARPDDLNSQKTAVWNSLAVLPYYDPVWFASPLPTPDTVLETYSALYHVDRVSLATTVSDIINGEDGTVAIGEDQSFYDAFALTYGQPPLVATTVSATVTWSQQGEGTLDVTQNIVSAFAAQGSAYSHTFPVTPWNGGGGGLISCLCGDGLKSDWPKPGTSIGGGWSLDPRTDGSGYPLCYIIDAVRPNGWITPAYYNVTFAGQTPPPSQAGNTTPQSNVNIYLLPYGPFSIGFPLNIYKIRMNLDYRANRKRTETVTAVMTAGVQRELSDSAESDRDSISLSSEYVDKAIDPNGQIPIGNVAYRSYFQTARGAASLEYVLLAARAKMRARARAVEVSFAVGWRTALGITLRKNVQLSDRRLPGGAVTGKVKSYRLNASTAGMLGEFTIGCTIGTGDLATPSVGVPSYVDDGYVNAGYEVVANQQVAPAALTDFYYETLDDFVVDDDGLNLTALTTSQAVNECVVTNGLSQQIPTLAAYQNSVVPVYGDPIGTMRSLTTTVTLDLKPVAGAEFHTAFFPAVTQLSLPMTIDLGAA